MACCLTTQSHCMNQCRLIISKVLWHPCVGIIINGYKDISQDKSKLKIAFIKSPPNLTGTNEWMRHNLPLTGFTVEVVVYTLRLEHNRWYFTDIFIANDHLLRHLNQRPPSLAPHQVTRNWFMLIHMPTFTCLICASFGGVHFYRRPVLAFGYCHRLRLCVCVSVCVCVTLCQSLACPRDNSGPVQARIAKFGPKMQKTLVKAPIVLGAIEIDLQGQI